MSEVRGEQPRIITAARIHTLAGSTVNAMMVRGGSIDAVGDIDELRALWPTAEVIDYATATITPGLTDSHIHITEWAVARQEIDLAGARSPTECVQRMAAAAGSASRSRGDWVLGRGWSVHDWGGEYPTRAVLDQILPDRPCAFQSHDMHALWVNSRALEAAGIDANTNDPPGGRILRNENFEPAGTLLENAGQLVVRQIPPPSDADACAAVLAAQTQLHAYGITGIHSLPGFHLIEPQPLRILQQLVERGQLRLRVLQHIAVDQLDDAISLGLRSGFGSEWLWLGGIKMFLDGTLGSRTAWLRKPYENSSDCGVVVLPERDFREAATRAARHGIASTVHAIGDAAVSLAFDVLTDPATQAGTLPNRIEHVQCCPNDRLRAAGRAGIICSMQPCHLINDWQPADRHWGAERARQTYAFASLLEHGATLAFGSDAPVEPCDPRLGLFAAVQRQDLRQQPADGWMAEQRISSRAALAGYTTGAAKAAGTSGRQGILTAGAWADFVVWDQDPLALQGQDLLTIRVRATFVGGSSVSLD